MLHGSCALHNSSERRVEISLMMWLLLIWGALIALWMAVEQYQPVSKVRGLARRLATRFAAEPVPPRALRD